MCTSTSYIINVRFESFIFFEKQTHRHKGEGIFVLNLDSSLAEYFIIYTFNKILAISEQPSTFYETLIWTTLFLLTSGTILKQYIKTQFLFPTVINVNCCSWYMIKATLILGPFESDAPCICMTVSIFSWSNLPISYDN